jgi:hypothetical protein
VKDIIWLRMSPRAVLGMTKSMPTVHAGEIAAKVNVEVSADAFRKPVLERTITITDWQEGVTLADVDLKVATITEDEAAQIRAARLVHMAEVLAAQGYTVTAPEPPEDPDQEA